MEAESRGRPGAPLPGLKVRRSRPLLHQCFRGAAAILMQELCRVRGGVASFRFSFATGAIRDAPGVDSQ